MTAFIVNPAADRNCPEELKDVIMEVVDFASDIHATREHDLTYSIAETHKCGVYHLTFGPKFVSTEDIEKDHPRVAKTLRERGVEIVL